jgi:hypothetical protein
VLYACFPLERTPLRGLIGSRRGSAPRSNVCDQIADGVETRRSSAADPIHHAIRPQKVPRAFQLLLRTLKRAIVCPEESEMKLVFVPPACSTDSDSIPIDEDDVPLASR